MENIKATYMPVGHAVKVNYRVDKFAKFVKRNKLLLTIGAVAITLLTTYAILIVNFINLLKILAK